MRAIDTRTHPTEFARLCSQYGLGTSREVWEAVAADSGVEVSSLRTIQRWLRGDVPTPAVATAWIKVKIRG